MRVGQPEASITSAVETLLSSAANLLGLPIRIHREAANHFLGVRPDLAVDVDGAHVGVIELKAPGKGTPDSPTWGVGNDRTQWQKLQSLPNVLYTDGKQWALYHEGNLDTAAFATLDGDLAKAGAGLRPHDHQFAAILQDFLAWRPSPPHDLRALIKISARLCQLLREDVAEALRRERTDGISPLFSDHLDDWREWLFPELKDAEFVDAYAQTVTFGLLLARREGVVFEGLELPGIGEKLAKRHLLVGRALTLLTERPDRGASIEERSIVLQTMRRVIGAADWSTWKIGANYHWLYEEFLEAYDPELRKQTGAYYTPAPVADFMTAFADDVLRRHLDVGRGLASEDVIVLDPAMGTGTFLQSVVDRVAEGVHDERGDVPASLRALIGRLVGFERQIGPFAVAELKLDQALEAHGAEANEEDFRLYVADTLDDPINAPIPPRRARSYKPLALSREAANKVKMSEPVMVVIANPPYRSRAKKEGKWILAKSRGKESLLDSFRLDGNGRHEYKLHDLAIYFWRWSLWKAFESIKHEPAGLVALITTSAYLTGPGFAGMRSFLRRQADFGWIIDVSPEGHRSDVRSRIFPGVPHPVCIGLFARGPQARPQTPARVRYIAVSGTQAEKFAKLKDVNLDSPGFADCSIEWASSFRPASNTRWASNPCLNDILPMDSPGVKANRTWVVAPEREMLEHRWRALVRAAPARKRELMKETRDRTIDRASSSSTPARGTIRDETAPRPEVVQYAFRSFDRQFLILDDRLIDFQRPRLWGLSSADQVYLITQSSEAVTSGPAVVFAETPPDMHYFSGRGGRVITLFRDGAGGVANIAPRLASVIRSRLAANIAPEDLFAYVAGVMSHPGYVANFRGELVNPGLRVPLTASRKLWDRSVEIGRRVIWLHTYARRFTSPADDRPVGLPQDLRPGVISPIPGSVAGMPSSIAYSDESQALVLGSGLIGPVSRRAWDYEVSGMRVIKHWFGYRKRVPAGRKGSELDELVADRWTLAMTESLRDLVAVVEGCVALEPDQAELLGEIVTGPLITTENLLEAGVLPVPADARGVVATNLEGVLFE